MHPSLVSRFVWVCLWCGLVAGCGPESSETADPPLTSLTRPPALAGLSERVWRRLPQVSGVDAAVRTDTGWILLDAYERTLHLLDSVAGYGGSSAGPGRGPGELRAPRFLAADSAGLWVVGQGGILDHFDSRGAFTRRLRLSVPGCPAPDPHDARMYHDTLYLAVGCIRRDGLRGMVVAVDTTGTGRTILDRRLGSTGSLGILRGSLAVHADRLTYGSGGDRCLTAVRGADSAPPCLSGAPEPMPTELRRELTTALGSRARSAGFNLELPLLLPWFDALIPLGGQLLARRPISGVSWALEPFGPDPQRWSLPRGTQVFGDRDRILLVHLFDDGVAVASLRADEIPWPSSLPSSPTPGEER